MTFETFNRCLQSQISKLEKSGYQNDAQFMNAVHSVFTNNMDRTKDAKKKVSFELTGGKRKTVNLSKSTTLKTTSSKDKDKDKDKGSLGSDDIRFEDFDKFFQKFMLNYSEPGYTRTSITSRSSGKVVHFMDNRENDEDSKSTTRNVNQKVQCRSRNMQPRQLTVKYRSRLHVVYVSEKVTQVRI